MNIRIKKNRKIGQKTNETHKTRWEWKTTLNVSVNVTADKFISSLNTLMLGLSQDIVNVDFVLYIEFITFYFEGEIPESQIESLLRNCSIIDHANNLHDLQSTGG